MPIYPQSRVQLGIAKAVIDRYGLVECSRVIRFGLADRLTGERSFKIAAGPAELEAAAAEYWLNSLPRVANCAVRNWLNDRCWRLGWNFESVGQYSPYPDE